MSPAHLTLKLEAQHSLQLSSITTASAHLSTMSSSDPPRPRAGLSLYANLLNPNSSTSTSSGTISRAPVVFSQNAAQDSQQHDASAKKHLNAGRDILTLPKDLLKRGIWLTFPSVLPSKQLLCAFSLRKDRNYQLRKRSQNRVSPRLQPPRRMHLQ